ncbi:hypothetical protein F0U60_54545 [Archangium minus]|uniref:Right handed beta helix domain-containing protein n=1 Tax=Archangium minus TaxID=83450 RepID=A0ABY9X9R5_9BACT|nr:hypothetical protein F0U61_54525 [Archangium violaceum]WNG52134.1 hypothetical protein F0U60_54545 [Archangium minus]
MRVKTAIFCGILVACGGGAGPVDIHEPGGDEGSGAPETQTPVTPPAPTAPTSPEVSPAQLSLRPCEPSGKGKDYQVGPGAGQLASLAEVPWESLAAGDTVRVFHRSTPYRGKILLAAQAREDAPVRVCGVPGPNGERPVISGQDAVARRGLDYGHELHESRSVIVINRLYAQDWTAFPKNIQIDGLRIQGAHPKYQFTDSKGVRKNYVEFGACVWVERGNNIVIANNEITDCTHAIFSRSTDDGDFAVTRNLRIAGNHMHGNGVAGSYLVHNTYIQSVGVTYEFNHYGPLREGALGNALKDRSVGPVIRYNRIEDGARALDLVEAEDYSPVATANPAYRTTLVYGNQIVKDGRKGTTIHYGGDHAGNEAIYRKGTLYFFNNTVHLTGDGYAVLFQLSTTEEKAEVWNNIFVFDAAIQYPRMREKQDNAEGIPSGGIVNLGLNWIDAKWSDAGPWHTVGGELNGEENLITGTTPPIDMKTLVPLAGSAVLDVAQSGPAAASGHPVQYQLDAAYKPKARVAVGARMDLGALERP